MENETQSAPTAAGIVAPAVQPRPARRRGKATHSGTCQVCGRLQKLPRGVLSKHGYTNRWGFFEGTCPGAHYRPFETHWDRIQVAIDRTKTQIVALQDLQALLRAPVATNEAPFRTYDAYLGGYYETQVIVELVNGAIRLTQKNATVPKIQWGNQYGLFGTVEQAVRKLRDSRVDRIVGEIRQRTEYIRWQQNRIDTWKPGTLTPVKEGQ